MPEEFTLQGKKGKVEIKVGKKILYKMDRDNTGMWIKPENAVEDWKTAGIKRMNTEGEELAKELHERYGHISYNTLRTLPEYLKNVGKEKIRCKACEQGKATKPNAPKQPQEPRSTRLMECLHVDLIGPIKPATLSKEYKYLLNIIEDYSRYMIVIPLRTKAAASSALIKAINEMEAATNLRLSKLQANWGGEFRNQELETELQQWGIILKPTIPKHSETNAIIERANRTILEMCRTVLISAGLPKGLWDKASDAMAYTKNRVPHKTLQGKTPIEIFLSKDPVKERANL